MNPLLCPDSAPNFLGLFDTTIAPTLLFYSYLPIIFIAVFFGLYVYFKDNRSMQSKGLLLISLSFSFFLLNEIVQWIAVRADLVHFGWQMSAILQPLIFGSVFYFVYVFLYKRSLPFRYELILTFLFLPVILLLPTIYNMSAFDIYECESLNGLLWDYIYLIEVAFLVLIGYLTLDRYRNSEDRSFKNQIIYLGVSSVAFLAIFGATNIIGDSTFVYEFNLIGPVGMAVFISSLFYMVVRFKTFNIKLLATQALVVGIWLLVFATLFIRRIENVRIVILLTLVLLLLLGLQLIKSVKREVALREDLEVANVGQANLLHIINHQIKGYMNKARIVFDALSTDPDYGPMPEAAKPLVKEGFDSVTEGVTFVQNFLNASNVERGTYTYNMMPVDFDKIVLAMTEKQKSVAEAKGLSFEVKVEEGSYAFSGDKAQLDEAVKNLIDNSINYTPTGGLKVNLSRKGDKILFVVSDTGVGLSDEVKPKLFTKGGRDKDSQKININSTGFGLAFVKGVVEAHKGRVWAESPGVGKGSTFYMELPVV